MIVCRGIAGGNGFGNEFLCTAKALVCSLDLGLPFWKARWLPNYSGLPKYIHESSYLRHRLRYVRYRANHHFRQFTGEAYQSTGKIGISSALKEYINARRLQKESNYVFTFPGLYPGLPSIAHRSEYLRSVLMQDRGIAGQVYGNLDRMPSGKIRVGIHIRRGDFCRAMPMGQRWPDDEWKIQVPLEWYDLVCNALERTFRDKISFYLTSNSRDQEISDFTRTHECVEGLISDARSVRDVADLLTLSYCDIIVASVSWFSHWAILFSNRPYIYYKYAPMPSIRCHHEGVKDINACHAGENWSVPLFLIKKYA